MKLEDLGKLAEIHRSIFEEREVLDAMAKDLRGKDNTFVLESVSDGLSCALKLLEIKINLEVEEVE